MCLILTQKKTCFTLFCLNTICKRTRSSAIAESQRGRVVPRVVAHLKTGKRNDQQDYRTQQKYVVDFYTRKKWGVKKHCLTPTSKSGGSKDPLDPVLLRSMAVGRK